MSDYLTSEGVPERLLQMKFRGQRRRVGKKWLFPNFEVGFSVRVWNCMQRSGFESVGHAVAHLLKSGGVLPSIRNWGSKSNHEFRAFLLALPDLPIQLRDQPLLSLEAQWASLETVAPMAIPDANGVVNSGRCTDTRAALVEISNEFRGALATLDRYLSEAK